MWQFRRRRCTVKHVALVAGCVLFLLLFAFRLSKSDATSQIVQGRNLSNLDGNRPNLLFMPVGDKGAFKDFKAPPWLLRDRNFDTVCVYYNNDAKMLAFLKRTCDYTFRPPVVDSNGNFHAVTFPMNDFDWWVPPSKIQTFYRMWFAQESQVQQLLRSYQAIGIWDDDAVILKGTVDFVFDVLNSGRWDLQVAIPSFLAAPDTWATYPLLHHITTGDINHLRKVRFAEINFPIFKQSAVAQLMDAYNDKLIAWGVDVLFSCMWPEQMAVVNSVMVANFKKRSNGEREVAKVYGGQVPALAGKANWEAWAEKHGYSACTDEVFAHARSKNPPQIRIPIPPVGAIF